VCAACGMSVNACRSCGESLVAGDRYCPRCGTFVDPTAPGSLSAGTGQLGQFDDQWRRIVDRLRAATVGEFEVIGEIGRGGMAVVCLGREVALNRKVAIKIMSPALLTGQGMIDRFRLEAITVANLSHPNIITIHAVRQIDDLHFFVMKFVEGRSLDSILRDHGTLSVGTVRALLFMVGSALAYAHRRGVIHRDTKPANILIDVDGNAIVTDFGIAKASGGQNHTQTGAILGTLAYMSPEQCYGHPVSAASDQYSLGVVAFELLTGAPPFTGSTYTVMHAHAEHPVPSMRARRADCPPDLEAAIIRMMAKNPADRFPSLTEALTALGATSLPDDHPVRQELAALAQGTHPRLRLIPQPTQSAELGTLAVDVRPTPVVAGGSAAPARVPEMQNDGTAQESSFGAQPASTRARSRMRWFIPPVVIFAVGLPAFLLTRGPSGGAGSNPPLDSVAQRVGNPTAQGRTDGTSPSNLASGINSSSKDVGAKRGIEDRPSGTRDRSVQPPIQKGSASTASADSNLSLPASLNRVREDMRIAKARSDSGNYVGADSRYDQAHRRASAVLQRFPGNADATTLIQEIAQERKSVRTACKVESDTQKRQKLTPVECP
jgi:serine/threonine protein kinase